MQHNKLYLGDCFDIMADFPDGAFNMVLCDMPYNITACAYETAFDLAKLMQEYVRLCTGAIVLTASQPFATDLINAGRPYFRYEWVWVKPQGVDPFQAKYRPLNNIEYALVFSKTTPVPYYPVKTAGKPYHVHRDKKGRHYHKYGRDIKPSETKNEGTRLPVRTLAFNQERGLHPSQKPVGLFEYFIQTYTKPWELVLDNCTGSGTTAIAAMNAGRNWVGIEKDFNHYQTAKERIESHA